MAISALVVPLAGLAGPAPAPLLTAQVITGAGGAIWSVNQMSLRRHLAPVRLLGRVTAARGFLLFGAAPLGSAPGGVLGGAVGLRATLLVGAIGVFGALALLFFSPRTRRPPPVRCGWTRVVHTSTPRSACAPQGRRSGPVDNSTSS